MPYRDGRLQSPKLAPEAGIVDEMVRQFADRYAFLRELVQNSIDAGATRIDVRIERDIEGLVRTVVDDDGTGMSRTIIEGPLLTLFSSSKESDASKIGKYGIGFVSVFATEPDRVEVETFAAGHEAWVVRLFGDHSFELARGTRERTGTTVTLVHTMTSEELAEHGSLAEAALTRWCRHAHVPIRFEVIDGDSPHHGGVIGINAPFTFTEGGGVSVSTDEDGERFVVATGDVSAAGSATTFAGFYNRGLTLFETTVAEPGLAGVRFKVDSPKLSHTLSRDSVRRDRELDRVLRRVRRLVREDVFVALGRRIADAAARMTAPAEYASLLAAAMAPAFVEQGLDALAVPLVERMAGMTASTFDRVVARSEGCVVVAGESSPITRALARVEVPVVRGAAIEHVLRAVFAAHVRKGSPSVFLVEKIYSHASSADVVLRPEDEALLAEIRRVLGVLGRAVGTAQLARFSGAAIGGGYCVAPGPTAEIVMRAPSDGAREARPWGRSSTLFLDVEDANVRLARRRAKSDPRVAAHLLCRVLLLTDGPLAPSDVDRLLASAGRSDA